MSATVTKTATSEKERDELLQQLSNDGYATKVTTEQTTQGTKFTICGVKLNSGSPGRFITE